MYFMKKKEKSNVGVIQPHMIKSDTYSQEEEEELIVQIDMSAWKGLLWLLLLQVFSVTLVHF